MLNPDFSLAASILSDSQQEIHRRWFEGGCTGDGRIDVEAINLTDAVIPGAYLRGARFVQCNLTNSNLRTSNLRDAEIIECILDDSLLFSARFDRAIIKNCRIVAAYFELTDFIETKVQGGDWSKTDLDNSTWTGALVENVCFQQVNFWRSRLHSARFVNCDFRGASLRAAKTDNAIFERCDFRGAYLESFQFKNVVFKQCGFYGCVGTPRLEEGCQMIEPDLSAEFDQTGVVSSKQLFTLWGLSDTNSKPKPVIGIDQSPEWLEYLRSEKRGEQVRWVDQGRSGPRPMEVFGKNLSFAFVYEGYLSQSRFFGCNFTSADLRLVDMQEAQLSECIFDSALLMGLQGQKSQWHSCRGNGAILNRSELQEATLISGDWSGSQFHNCMWYYVRVENVCFRNTSWRKADLEGSVFINCDFRDTQWREVEAAKVVFEGCDFRGSDLEMLIMDQTTFSKCCFYNCRGTPFYDHLSDETSSIIEPDLSENFDGTNVVDFQDIDQFFELLTARQNNGWL